jgi:hypothetical protein
MLPGIEDSGDHFVEQSRGGELEALLRKGYQQPPPDCTIVTKGGGRTVSPMWRAGE